MAPGPVRVTVQVWPLVGVLSKMPTWATGAWVSTKVAVHVLASRLRIASRLSVAVASSETGPVALIMLAKMVAMRAWVSATTVPK